MTESDDFPTLDDAERAVVTDALEDGRPQSLAAVDVLVARAGLGPIEFDESAIYHFKIGTPGCDWEVGSFAALDPFSRTIGWYLDAATQMGYPIPARHVLAEIDSPGGQMAIANEERRRRRNLERRPVPVGFSIGGGRRAGKSAAAMERGEAYHRALSDYYKGYAAGASALDFIPQEIRDAAEEARRRENLRLLEDINRKDPK